MYVSVYPANILVFYFSAIRRDIDLKFIQDTYRVVLNSLKVTGQGHRVGTLPFEGTVIERERFIWQFLKHIYKHLQVHNRRVT